jgi:inosine/xanthosine triphosphatase
MGRIVVASANPVKLRAVQQGFARLFPEQDWQVETISVPSGVSDQPGSDAETLQGALNRAQAACTALPEADYWVGLEGGIEDEGAGMAAFAWIAVLGVGRRLGKARTGIFYLPPKVAELVRQGKELGEADDIVFGKTNSKQANGAIGILTGDVLDRADFYTQAVILALLPFRNPQLY